MFALTTPCFRLSSVASSYPRALAATSLNDVIFGAIREIFVPISVPVDCTNFNFCKSLFSFNIMRLLCFVLVLFENSILSHSTI